MTEVREGYRLEHDPIGEEGVPINAYYDMQTLRAHESFSIIELKMHPEFVVNVAQVKKATAITNFEVGELSKEYTSAIVKACDEIIDDKPHGQLIVDPIQGGVGTPLDMNANEVIASRAVEILGDTKGGHSIVNPNSHVNLDQFTNDAFPSCGRMAALTSLRHAQIQLKRLEKALFEKPDEFDAVIKMGRMQLQDAVLIRPGQEFHTYASVIGHDTHRFDNVGEEIHSLNMSDTAIGISLNADTTYFHRVVKNMSTIIGEELVQSYDTIDATQNLDSYAMISGIIKSCTVNLSKMCNDLRLMFSSPRTDFCEINLPIKQSGPPTMPGKINPVIPEVVNQVAFNVIGNDVTTTMTAEADQLELNMFKSIIFYNLFEPIQTLNNVVQTPTGNCIAGIMASKEHCRKMIESSIGIITAICLYIDYETVANIAKEALHTNQSVYELILQKKLFSEEQPKTTLDPYTMIKPGIQDRNPVDLLPDWVSP